MFASVCSGRPVQLAQQVDGNKYAINIPQGSKISHVCIFLLPEAQLPREYKALIYFKLPGDSEFKLLGSISQDKQSSIFKLKNKDEVDGDEDSMIEEIDDQDVVTVGISIETAEVARQLEDSQSALVKKTIMTRPVITEPLTTSEKTQLAAKVVKNAYNYLSSFIDNNGNVNIKYFDSWWNKFQAKLKNDDKFLDSD